MRREINTGSVVHAIYLAIEALPDPFEVEVTGAGLEVRPSAPLEDGLPNRARMKVFAPRPGHTLVFFYKCSLVPYSRDRHSFGGVELKEAEAPPAEVREWLAFLSSGFHPEKRPARLRRAFPYEIPE